MKYLEMVKAAKKNGTFAEKQMWDSVESVSELLDDIKDSHPERYWQFLREQYGIMNNRHYADREFAEWDVAQMYSIGRDDKKWEGAYWSVEQIEEATKANNSHPAQPNGISLSHTMPPNMIGVRILTTRAS